MKKANELGLQEQLVLTGMISDTATLDALYACADLFVFPSLYDTFSLVIREAAAMGTPSVAVVGSAAAESIQDGSNGYLCEDDAGSLYQVLKTVLEDPEKAKSVGEEAKRTIPVSWEDVITQAAARYENLVSKYICKPGNSNLRYQRKKSRQT
jgi:glycosyltransferase involved in cell wall biosynthesis